MGAFNRQTSDWHISSARSFILGELIQSGTYHFSFTSQRAGFTSANPLQVLFLGVGVGFSVGIFSALAQGRAFGLKGDALKMANQQRSQLSHTAERIGRVIEQSGSLTSRCNDLLPERSQGAGTRINCTIPFSAHDLNLAQGAIGKVEVGVGASVSGEGIIAFNGRTILFAQSSINSGISFGPGITGLVGLWKVISDPTPEYGNLWFARGYVQSLFRNVTQPAALMEERDRTRFIEGINAAERNRSTVDSEGRDLQTHIIHYYFRDSPEIQRQLRRRGASGASIRIDQEELARRIARFLNNNPGTPVEWGYN